MKFLIAMDSFKGSLSSVEAGNAVKRGIEKVCDASIVVKPLADGGEGTTEALVEGLGGNYISIDVTGPLGKLVRARYGILQDNRTAVIEMAEAAGIMLMKKEELDPFRATTYGVGEMILNAIHRGCREFIIGIGGSATSDGGIGMLQALGFDIKDEQGNSVKPGIQGLGQINTISARNVPEILEKCHFHIACDVKNPLCGKNGAIYVYGSQKGIKENEKKIYDQEMSHFADKTKEYMGTDYRNIEGTGAAGGLGFAFLSYIPNTELKSGIEIILNAIDLEKEIEDTDIVITGEGQMDGQTSMGKTPVGIAHLSKKHGKKVIALAGTVTDDACFCNKEGIDAFFPVIRKITTLKEAMDPEIAKKNIELTTEQIIRTLQLGMGKI